VSWREVLALACFAVACALVAVAGYAVPLLARKIALRGTGGEAGQESAEADSPSSALGMRRP
jgi:hypothetical protein